MIRLMGYTFVYGRGDTYADINAYFNDPIYIYKTLAECYKAICVKFDNDFTKTDHIDKLLVLKEGTAWSDGWEVGILDESFRVCAIFIKCILSEE